MLFSCGYSDAINLNKKINDTNIHYKKQNKISWCENGIPPFDHSQILKGRAPYVTFRASITVEASIVVPLVVMAVVSLLQIMIFMNVQLKLQTALYHQTQKAAGYSALVDFAEGYILEGMDREDYKTALSIAENGITELLVKHLVVEELGEDFFDNPWFVGGQDGLKVIFSAGVKERDIDVALGYELKVLFDVFGIGDLHVTARARMSRWTGVTRVESNEEGMENSDTVYITKAGTVYHLYKDCTYLSVKLTKVNYSEISSKRNASGGKYYPCSLCAKNSGEADCVYISKYGESYHFDEKCRNIYHNISEITKDEVGNREMCSKCRKRKGTREE